MEVSTENGMNAADVLLGPALAGGVTSPALITNLENVHYSDLEKRASQAGYALRARGVGPDDRVLLIVDDRPEFFYTYLGAMKIGAVPVAISLRITASDLAYIIADSACKAIVTDCAFALLVTEALGDAEGPAIIVADRPSDAFPGLADLMAEHPSSIPSVPRSPDDMAFWMYTSGTTGAPKAVVHRQASIPTLDRYLGPEFGVTAGNKLFCSSKLFFAFSLGHIFFAGLKLGASMILNTGWPSADAIADVVTKHHPDVVFSVPAMYRLLLQDGVADTAAFKGVKRYISAGEHLSETLFSRWQDITGRSICEGIGATEAVIMFIGNRPDDVQSGATGRPYPGTDVRLLDNAGNEIEEENTAGVLWIRCPSLSAEYWNLPDKTAEAFVDGWYCTGDVLFRDGNGRFHYQGRHDDMLKISGQWVSPAEIEEHVVTNPHISEAAVVGVENAEGLTRLALCAVLEGDGVDTGQLEDDICDTLKAKLAIYKCPRRFVFLDDFPKTVTGKVQRFKLRQIAADQLLKDGAS